MEWAHWMENQDRSVAQTKGPNCEVSTVFLGLDQSLINNRQILYETMVFGGEFDRKGSRYCTWDEAEDEHIKWCIESFEFGGSLFVWSDEKV